VGHRRTYRIPVQNDESSLTYGVPMDSRVDNGRGPTKRRTLDRFYAERSPDPTRAFSPRQLPTNHVHAVSTRVYQCDPSSRQLPGCYRPCCPSRKRSRLTSGNVFPPKPPIGIPLMPERCSHARVRCAAPQSRRALACCAPFRPDPFRDGRLRREHLTTRCQIQKGKYTIKTNPELIRA
jgi:hypothetical protein